MRADPNALLALLDLQARDSEADKLRHQRSHLPQIADIAALTVRRDEVLGATRDQQIVVDDLTAAQAKADADVEQVRARRTRDRERMDQGLVSNPKDLERMQHEMATLERRITTLEDEELEVMQQLEDTQRALEADRTELQGLEEKLAELATARDQEQARIDAELDRIAGERAEIVGGIPEDLLALYDRLRANKGGVGAAELRARQCGGCMLTLDNAEIQRIRGRDEDEVIRCEECQRILVRTAESGL